MTEVIKLTCADDKTYGEMLWRVGKTNRVKWGGKMCADGCLHGYRSVELAVLAKPIHCPGYTRALVCETPKILVDDGLKIGMAEMTGICWVDLPKPTTEQRVEWAIRCALLVPQTENYETWAENWLSGTDRSAKAAAEAAWESAEAAEAAKARAAAARAAEDAARAAKARVGVAKAHAAEDAARAAKARVGAPWAAKARAEAGVKAAWAAAWAAKAEDDISDQINAIAIELLNI